MAQAFIDVMIDFKEIMEMNATDYINGMLHEGETEEWILHEAYEYMDDDECLELADTTTLEALKIIQLVYPFDKVDAIRSYFCDTVHHLYELVKDEWDDDHPTEEDWGSEDECPLLVEGSQEVA
jgi:hypothetical protein